MYYPPAGLLIFNVCVRTLHVLRVSYVLRYIKTTLRGPLELSIYTLGLLGPGELMLFSLMTKFQFRCSREKGHKAEKAMELFVDMQQRGLEPDVKAEKAMELLAVMPNGTPPTVCRLAAPQPPPPFPGPQRQAACRRVDG